MQTFLSLTIIAFLCTVTAWFFVRKWAAIRVSSIFSAAVAEGELEKADLAFDQLLHASPHILFSNDTIHIASINVNMLRSELPSSRLKDFFRRMAEKVEDSKPLSIEGDLFRAGIKLQHNEYAEAIALITIAAAASAKNNYRSFVHAGELLATSGYMRRAYAYFLDALNRLEQLPKVDPNEKAGILRMLGNTSKILGKSADAISYWSKAAALTTDPEIKTFLCLSSAIELQHRGDFSHALLLYLSAIQHKKDAILGIMPDLELCALNIGTPDLADTMVDTITKDKVPQSLIDLAKCAIYMHEGDTEQIRHLLKEIPYEHMDSPDIQRATALLYQQIGDMPQSIMYLERAIKKSSDITPPHIMAAISVGAPEEDLAQAYIDTNRPDDAEEILKRLVKKYPSDISIKIKYASLLKGKAAEKLYDEAYNMLLNIIEEVPDSPPINYIMGQYYEARGNNLKALKYVLKALKIYPFNDKYLQKAAHLCSILDFKDSARDFYGMLLKASVNYSFLEEARTYLQAYAEISED